MMMDINGVDRIDFDVVGCGAGYSNLSFTIGGEKNYTTLIYSVTVSPNRGSSGGDSRVGGWTSRGYDGMGGSSGGGGSGWTRGGNGGGGGGGGRSGGRTGGGLRLLDRLDGANRIISPTTGWLNLIGAAAEAANAGNVAKTAADLQVEKILGKVGKIGKAANRFGAAVTLGINAYNLYENPRLTRNWVKMGISVGIIVVGAIPYAGPILSLGLSAYEIEGGFEWLYNMFDDK